VIKIANYDSIDLDWTWDGDYLLGLDGDLKDTSYDFIQSFVNEVRTIIKADFNDWLKQPNLGCRLLDFKGEPNNRDTATSIQQRIQSKLQENLIKPGDLTVTIVPVHVNAVLITLTIQADATPGNSLQLGQPIVTSLIYDSAENSIFFLPPPELNPPANPVAYSP
jgi:hypothetical protein